MISWFNLYFDLMYIQRKEENMFESDKGTAQNRHDEEVPKKFNDQTRKIVQQFLKIEGNS